MLTNKKIFVTGATGFIGANLVRRLLADKNEVHILTRATSDKWRLADILGRLHEHAADLTDKEKLSEILNQIKPEIIFHLATYSFFWGIDFRSAETEIIKINLIGTMNLISACEKFNYQAFINTGTSSEYGPKTDVMREDQLCQPLTVYAISKVATSMYVSFYAKTNNRPLVTVRPFSPYGPYDDFRRMIPEIVIKALKHQPIIIKNPWGVRDYIFINDLIDGFLLAANKATKFPGEIFNLGAGQQQQVIKVAEKIVELIGSRSHLEIQESGWSPNESSVWQADISKTYQALGWQPKYQFEQGLKKTIDWFRQNLELYQ